MVTELRPWGSFTNLYDTQFTKVKSILVNPGQRLSLQSHEHRSEHWVVIRGKAKVQLDEVTLDLLPSQSVFIPQGSKHRLSNPGLEELEVIEVQTGTYFGEDDIKRYSDDYNRA